ncbi:MAG: glycosyltransferase family 1 protein [Oscillospiraceae bacterium]|nr:glycosyltransferase family 1 protein [Oscillospiraceae bacterium]
MEPIRILHIVGAMDRGGMESRTMDIYRNIDLNKVQFDFMVRDPNKAHFDDEILELGGKIFCHSRKRLKRIFNYLYRVIKLMKNYKIVHIHTANASNVLDAVCAVLAGVKLRIIHSRNSFDTRAKTHKIFKWFIPLFANYYLAVSEASGEWMFHKRLLKNNRYKKINNAIDSRKFSFSTETRNKMRKEFNLANEFVIGHVGNFSASKNHEFLLKVYAEVLEKIPGSVLLLAGDGVLREQIENRISELNIKNKVILLGVREDIPELLQVFDIFAFPSYFEGLPGSVLEAQAAGLKVLLSDKITREVGVVQGLTEFLPIDEGTALWVERIMNFYESGFVRKNTHDDFVNAGFDIKSVAAQYEKLYLDFK